MDALLQDAKALPPNMMTGLKGASAPERAGSGSERLLSVHEQRPRPGARGRIPKSKSKLMRLFKR